MSAFSVFSREHDPTDDASADSAEAAVVSYRRTATASGAARMAAPSLRTPRGATQLEVLSLDEGPLPEVMLKLPDLTAEAAELNQGWFSWTRAWQFVNTWSYWLFVGVGAVVAIVLITTGKKVPPAAMDEAPAWTPPPASAAPQASTGQPASMQHPGAQQPAAQQPIEHSHGVPTWNGPASDGQHHTPARRPAMPAIGYMPAGTSQASEPSAQVSQNNVDYNLPAGAAAPAVEAPYPNTAPAAPAYQETAPQNTATTEDAPVDRYQDRYKNRYQDPPYEDSRYAPGSTTQGSTAPDSRYAQTTAPEAASPYATSNTAQDNRYAEAAAPQVASRYAQRPELSAQPPVQTPAAGAATAPPAYYQPPATGAAPAQPYAAGATAPAGQPGATTAAPYYPTSAAPTTPPAGAYPPSPGAYPPAGYAPAGYAAGAPNPNYPPAGANPGANMNPNMPAPPPARTAQGSAPTWDGSSPTVPPSGAAPLGTNPSVP